MEQFFELINGGFLNIFLNVKTAVLGIILLSFFINLIIEKTLIRTIFWFVSFIIILSIIFVLIDFDFLGFALFIIYVGSVVILFIFIIMTTDLRSYENKDITLNWKLFFTLIISLIFSGLFFFYFTDFFESRDITKYGLSSAKVNQMGIIGQEIYLDPSLLLFLTFILLLTLIGSMYILNLLEDTSNYIRFKKRRFNLIERANGFLEKKKEENIFFSAFSLFSIYQEHIFEYIKLWVLWFSWFIPIILLFIPFFIKKKNNDKIVKILNIIFLSWLILLIIIFLLVLGKNFLFYSIDWKLLCSTLPENYLWNSFNRNFYCYFVDLIILLLLIFYVIHNLFWLNSVSNNEFMQKNKHNLGYLYALFSIWLISTIFIFFSESYIHFFILMEILTFTSLFLILIQTYEQDNNAKKQHYRIGLKYIITAAFGSIAMLFAILIIYQKTGDLSYEGLHYNFLFLNSKSDFMLPIIFIFILGLFVKTGISPFHWWLISVYGELTNFFFVFFSIVPKIFFVGVFTLQLFIFMPFGSDLRDYLLVFAFINLFIGLFSAIGEKKSFRRFFVFSSVTHFGHIIVALSLLTTFGFMLALTYLIIYLFIFFIIYYKLLEKRDLNSDSFNILTFSVLNEKTRVILLLTLLSLTGLPLFPFFFCKIFIILNYWYCKMYYTIGIYVIITIISSYYYLEFLKEIFFNTNSTWILFKNIWTYYAKKENIGSFIIIITLFIGINIITYIFLNNICNPN